MAVIEVAITDSTPIPYAWENLGGEEQARSIVPRGKVLFVGNDIIPLKVAGNETQYNLTLTLPDGFAYIARYIVIRIVSTTLVLEFDLVGSGQFTRPSLNLPTGFESNTWFAMDSPGAQNFKAVNKTQVYTPSRGSPKVICKGGDSMEFFLSDMDAGETPIANAIYEVEFLVFDLNQVDKWEINTPIPVLTQVF